MDSWKCFLVNYTRARTYCVQCDKSSRSYRSTYLGSIENGCPRLRSCTGSWSHGHGVARVTSASSGRRTLARKYKVHPTKIFQQQLLSYRRTRSTLAGVARESVTSGNDGQKGEGEESVHCRIDRFRTWGLFNDRLTSDCGVVVCLRSHVGWADLSDYTRSSCHDAIIYR